MWLITGASSGFGRAIADAALERGDSVVACARRTGDLDDLAASDRVLVVSLDVTDAAQREAADAKALAAERRAKSILQGYTGNMCSECQNFTMVRNGTCEKCDTCGATSGCS